MTGLKSAEGESTLSERLKKINAGFDRVTKEYRIFETILPFIVFFVFFLLLGSAFGFLKNYISSGLYDWFYLTQVSVPACVAAASFLFLLPKKGQAAVFPLLALFWIVYSFAQLCVSMSNSSMFRIVNVISGKDALEFADSVLLGIPAFIWIIYGVLLVLAAAAEIILIKRSVPAQTGMIRLVKTIGSAVCFLCFFCLVIFYKPADDNSYKDFIFSHFTDSESVYIQSDLYTYFVQDIKCTVTSRMRGKKDLETINTYFVNKPGHNDNEMTGIFKDKNLLIVQLESFEQSIMTEEVCPELVEIREQSISFENYYAPRNGSLPTFGNELAVNAGLYSPSDFNASTMIGSVDLPFSLASQFSSAGYSADVYHMNGPEFYNRSESEKAFGYEKYTSLKDLTDEELLFEDDGVIAGCDDIYNSMFKKERFMDYFIGYSAHPLYGLDMEGRYSDQYYEAAKRHPELVTSETPGEREVYTVLATLTDDMAGELLDRMEKDGTLDDTVILFVADHACLLSLEGTSGAENIKVQQVPCFIYAKGIEPQKISKVCSSIDMLPTLLNMFGIENCGYYIGNDIFDDGYEGFAYFPNMNWVTDKCMYVDGRISERYTQEEISDEYTDSISEQVRNNIEVNSLMIYTNYYSTLDP